MAECYKDMGREKLLVTINNNSSCPTLCNQNIRHFRAVIYLTASLKNIETDIPYDLAQHVRSQVGFTDIFNLRWRTKFDKGPEHFINGGCIIISS